MKMRFSDNSTKYVEVEKTEWVLYYCMKHDYVFHKRSVHTTKEYALAAAKLLEERCSCYTEVVEVYSLQRIYRRYVNAE